MRIRAISRHILGHRNSLILNGSLLLLFLLCGSAVAAQQAGTARTSGPGGQTIVSTYDSSGRLMSTTDGTGSMLRPGQASVTSSLSKTATQSLSAPQASASGITIHVPADQPTIQAAIDAANNGDTVLVSDGVYKENINFKGKAITVTSVNGPSATTIDGGAVDSVVTFRTSEGPTSVLNGFTIQNGFSNFSKPNFGDGGGVFIGNASPTVTNNVITKNQACEGLGIFINGAGALIQGNVISSNTASGCSGGIGGGGIAILGASTAQIIGNTITNNIMTISGLNGGGLSLFAAGSPVLRNNTISNNTQFGIAMVNGSTPQIVQNLIVNNTGGGLTTSASGSGAVYINNTLADNLGQSSFIAQFGLASGIGGSFPADAIIQNNLVIATPGQPAMFCTFTLPTGFLANDVFSNGGSAYDPSCTSQTGIHGNISSDPLFVDPPVENYHLQTISPAIDAGNNSTPITLPATDLDGNPRIVNTTADMGAFEFQGTTTATFSTTSLTFVAQLVGTTSPTQSVTINNTGTTALQIIPFVITGDFAETDNCHTSSGIAAAHGCTVNISFTPTARFSRTGQMTVTSNDAASPTTIKLSGTGIAPVVTLSGFSLTFTDQLVGSSSASQKVTLMNTGDAPLAVAGIVASGDFAQTNDCGTAVAISGSCSINVTFTPTVRGTRNGAVTITDSAAGTPHTISLQGHGVGPAATLSPSLVFSGQLVGTTSPAQPVTLSSNGETALTINSISAFGDFGQTNNCPNPLPNGQSCTIQVTFTPTARGMRSGTLSVTDNSTTSPEQVSLSGIGTAPVATLSRTSLAFGDQVLGVPISSPVTLTNTGDAALSITSIAATGDFSQTNDCGTSLAVQAHCTVTITFQATALGARIGSLTFTDSATGSPQSVSLSGNGVQIGFSQSSLVFGNQVVGTTSSAQMVTMTNLGSSTLTITSIVPSVGFSQTNNCGTSLAGKASCTINIAFAPTAAGLQNGLITVNYSGTQSTITVTGNGTDFNVAVQPGASGSSTISAGGTATYNLSMSGTSGFNASVNLACSGAPAAATCSVNPSSVNLNGTTPANFSVSVSTTVRSSAFTVPLNLPPKQPPYGPWPLLWGTVAAFGMAVFLHKKMRRAATLAAALGVLMVAGCGGGGGNPPKPPVQTGTPAGTYTIVVTATAGTTTRTFNLTLTVN